MDSAFTTLVADALGTTPFRLLDVGCSGGLDPRWRAFGSRLQAIGIDASRAECARLAKAETLAGVEYVAAFVAGVAGRPVDLERGQASPLIMAIRERLCFMRTREIRAARLAKAEIEETAAPQCLGDDRARRQHEAGSGDRAAGVARLDGVRLSQDRHRRLGLRGAADARRPAEARRACWACSSR